MKVLSIQNESPNMKNVLTAFPGLIAGLATLAHIPLPLLSWHWLPTVHVDDTILFGIALFKTCVTAGFSWLTVTGLQITKKRVIRKWKSFRNKK